MKSETGTPSLTETSIEVFRAYAEDAGNWSGVPLVGGNVGGTKEERGNLTQLKRAGLITTQVEPGDRRQHTPSTTWLCFTQAGIAFAATLGIDLSYIARTSAGAVEPPAVA